MGVTLALHEALERLLVDRDYRGAFLAGRHDLLSLSPTDLAALESIDPEQLVRTAERLRDDVLTRSYRGSGSLTTLFSATIAAWRAAHPEDAALRELAASFVASPAWRTYREVSWATAGRSLEEAFFDFCEAHAIGDPIVRERELHVALGKALAVSPEPDFVVPRALRRVRGGWLAVTTRGTPFLTAAVAGRFVQGELTPFLAELLTSPDPGEAIAARHHVAPAVLAAARARFEGLGLM